MTTLSQLADQIHNQLVNSDFGLESKYKPGYKAVAQENDEGGYMIAYFTTHDDMPPFNVEHFGNADGCVKEMLKVSMEWNEVEGEEI